MACCCWCTQYVDVSQLAYKQAGAFSSKSQAGFSLLLLSAPRGFLQLACWGGLGDGIFFLSCNSCRTPVLTYFHGLHIPLSLARVLFPFLHCFNLSFQKLLALLSLSALSFHSSTPLAKSWEQQRELNLQGLVAGEALVASCMVKWLFGMQSCEQPPSPSSPPRALCQRASICRAKLQSSLGNDLPIRSVQQVAGGRIHATPSQLNSHAHQEEMAIPPSQLLPGKRVTLPAEGCCGGESFSARSCSGL